MAFSATDAQDIAQDVAEVFSAYMGTLNHWELIKARHLRLVASEEQRVRLEYWDTFLARLELAPVPFALTDADLDMMCH